MTDQAPVSSRHVRIKLHKLADIPENVIEKTEIVTTITRYDRAETTVQMPSNLDRTAWDQWWWKELRWALSCLEGAEKSIPFAGVSQTFTVTWDGVCRPI